MNLIMSFFQLITIPFGVHYCLISYIEEMDASATDISETSSMIYVSSTDDTLSTRGDAYSTDRIGITSPSTP